MVNFQRSRSAKLLQHDDRCDDDDAARIPRGTAHDDGRDDDDAARIPRGTG